MWEQIRQRSRPLLPLSSTDKQTTSQAMAASVWKNVNQNTQVCSSMRKLRPGEYPTENLPRLATRASTSTPRRPLVHRPLQEDRHDSDDSDRMEQLPTLEIGVNTDGDQEVKKLEARIKVSKENDSSFSLESIAGDDLKVAFFPSYEHLKICFDFLGPAASQLIYRDSRRVFDHSNKGYHVHCLPWKNSSLVLSVYDLDDIAYRFGISQSTISRSFTSWINLMHIQSDTSVASKRFCS